MPGRIVADYRCTNCLLSEDSNIVCDLPRRTFYTVCLCEWWMPLEDRQRVKKWENDMFDLAEDTGRRLQNRRPGAKAMERLGELEREYVRLVRPAVFAH
jgi:hypothetical protein